MSHNFELVRFYPSKSIMDIVYQDIPDVQKEVKRDSDLRWILWVEEALREA